jgi:TonB family protein
VKSSGSQWAVIVGSLGIVALIGGGFLVLWLSHVARMNRLEAARVTSAVTPPPLDGSGSRSQNSFTPGEIPPSPGAAAVDTRPFPLNKPRPNYTEEARAHKVQGVIRAHALIGTDGVVKDVRLATHLPDGLDEEAIVAVKQMRFRPAARNGQPVDFWVTLEVEFSLR